MTELLNFYQITDTISTSGQPTAAQFADIAAAGCCAVVNLAMPNSDNAVPEEGSIVASLAMAYLHIPVPFDAPSADHLRAFCAVMDAFEHRRVHVHCALNLRVSAFVFQYLTLKKGVTPAQATSPFLEQWKPTMRPEWRALMELRAEDVT